jgi:hypothetical protein
LVHDERIEINNPKSLNEILGLNFWWNRIIHHWDVGFLKSKAVEFRGLGWVSMYSVWVAFIGKIASKEEMGKKIMFSLEEELGYERIIIKLEKVWGGLFKGGDNSCKEINWIGLLEKNKVFMSMVCCVLSTFKPKCNNNV